MDGRLGARRRWHGNIKRQYTRCAREVEVGLIGMYIHGVCMNGLGAVKVLVVCAEAGNRLHVHRDRSFSVVLSS